MRKFEKAIVSDLFFTRVCEPDHFSWEVRCQGQFFARVSKPFGDSYRVSFTYFPSLYGDEWEKGDNKSPDFDYEMMKDREEVLEKILSYWNRFIAGASK